MVCLAVPSHGFLIRECCEEKSTESPLEKSCNRVGFSETHFKLSIHIERAREYLVPRIKLLTTRERIVESAPRRDTCQCRKTVSGGHSLGMLPAPGELKVEMRPNAPQYTRQLHGLAPDVYSAKVKKLW